MNITNLTVMAEHGVDDPVWERPQGSGGPIRLADLKVAQDLVVRLREWNARYERALLDDSLTEGSVERDQWLDVGLQLAYALQAALPEVEIRYWEDGDRRPMWERQGG